MKSQTKIFLFKEFTKGGIEMVDVYVTLIVYHRRTIEQVPVSLQEAVLADLNAIGLDGYGNPIVVE
jgi:hypothetical protein